MPTPSSRPAENTLVVTTRKTRLSLTRRVPRRERPHLTSTPPDRAIWLPAFGRRQSILRDGDGNRCGTPMSAVGGTHDHSPQYGTGLKRLQVFYGPDPSNLQLVATNPRPTQDARRQRVKNTALCGLLLRLADYRWRGASLTAMRLSTKNASAPRACRLGSVRGRTSRA